MSVPEIPCGKTLGHGECCSKDHLCGQCQYIQKQEIKETDMFSVW